jgi:C4-dicarboxylate-binding protein DctP
VPNLQFGKAPGFQLPNCKFGTPERDKHFVKIYIWVQASSPFNRTFRLATNNNKETKMKTKSVCFSFVIIALTIGANLAIAEEKVFTLKIPSNITPAYEGVFPQLQGFADRVNELGNGRVRAELYHSESLFKVKDMVPALMNGACDIIFHLSSYTNEIWPELAGLSLPFLYKNEQECRERWSRGKPLFELVNHEMEKKYGIRILASGIMTSFQTVTYKVTPLAPEEFKGLKIRTLGKLDAYFIKSCGGLPLNDMPSSQMNEALKLGILDGVNTYLGTVAARNLDEFLDHVIETEPMFIGCGFQIFVLSKTFDSWPKEVQNIVRHAADEYDKALLEYLQEYDRKTVRPRLEKKMKFVSPTPEQMKMLVEKATETYDEWAKGVDPEFARKFLELNR